MKRSIVILSIWIFVSLILLFGLLSYYGVFDKIMYSFTGNQVFLDNEFNQPVGSIKTGKNSIFLSPNESDCVVDKISWENISANVGEIVKISVRGTNCNGQNVTVGIYEDDIWFDDYIDIFYDQFDKGNVSIYWLITEDVLKLYNEPFEGKLLEVYFNVLTDKGLDSSLLFISPEDKSLFLEPNSEGGVSESVGKNMEIRVVFWLVSVMLACGIIFICLSIINSFRKSNRN